MKPQEVIAEMLSLYPAEHRADALKQMIQDFAEDFAVAAGRDAARAELRDIARRLENGEL